MLNVKHFKYGNLYRVDAVIGEYVYYRGNGGLFKRHIAQFLSKDERSETGNKLDFDSYVGFVTLTLPLPSEYLDVTDYDEAGNMKINGLNVELARKIFKCY